MAETQYATDYDQYCTKLWYFLKQLSLPLDTHRKTSQELHQNTVFDRFGRSASHAPGFISLTTHQAKWYRQHFLDDGLVVLVLLELAEQVMVEQVPAEQGRQHLIHLSFDDDDVLVKKQHQDRTLSLKQQFIDNEQLAARHHQSHCLIQFPAH